MSRVDDILDLLDVGTQSSSEGGYPERHAAPGFCTRCCRNKSVENHDLCQDCRGFLLGDSDEDPTDDDTFAAYSAWFTIMESRPVEDCFPIVSAPRGGIRYVVPPDWAEPAS